MILPRRNVNICPRNAMRALKTPFPLRFFPKRQCPTVVPPLLLLRISATRTLVRWYADVSQRGDV